MNMCSAATTNPNFLVYCDQSKYGIPWRTQFKLAGTYPLPWWGLQFSGALQALPGYILYNTNSTPLQQGSITSPNASLNLPNGAGSVFTVTPTTKYTNVHEEGSPVRRSVATMEKRFVPQQGFHAFDHMLGVSLGDSAAHSDVAGLINQLA